MLKNNRKEKAKNTKILKLNLSTTMMVAGAIVFVILAIVAVRMIVTAINSNSQKALAEEETKGYTMVDSTELGEDGKPLQVPVPDGFTASQVPGETTVNGGFVIYEGEVDWSKIEDLDSYAEVATQAEETNTSSENSSSTENANSEDTNADGTNTEGASEGEEKSNIEAESNTESNTNSNEIEESVNSAENNTDGEEGQPQGEADVLGESEQGTASEENIANGEEETQKEGAGASENGENGNNGEGENQTAGNEETETTEEEKGEQENNEIINEEESISNEETEAATMAEDEADTGIATLAEGEEPTTLYELQTSVNQYVWVPVKDVSRIYGIASNGKLWGKLWQGVATDASTRSPRSSDWSESNGVMNIKDKTGYREPDVVPNLTYTGTTYDYDKDADLQSRLDGIEQYQMLSQEMEEKFYKMVESIKKYGGFYIGRYETGDLGKEEAVVKKMNTDIRSQTWYTMYEKSKNLAGTNENVQTSMIWGSLWDETIQWLLESGAQIQDGENGTREITESDINTDSTKWGNYSNATFEYRTTSGGTSTKNASSSTITPTGSAEYTKANNIYDLAGNVWDWTLEANSTNDRVFRGGYYYSYGSDFPASYRYSNYPTNNFNSYYLGCRASLYIK